MATMECARPINIVYVVDFQLGGSAESIYELISASVREYGANCTVIFAEEGPLKDKLDDIGVRTVVAGFGRFLVHRPEARWKTIPKYLIELVRYRCSRSIAVRRAEAAIDFSEVDIIHSNLPRNDLGVMLSKRHGIPHVCHLREFTFSHFRCWSYRKDPVSYLNEGSAAFIAVSKTCGDAWIERGISPEKMHVVYNGINVQALVSRCNEFRDKSVSDDGRVRMIFLGGCAEAKGVWDAIEATARLTKEYGKRIKLDIYGHYGTKFSHSSVQRYVCENQLEDIVMVYGQNDDIASILANHDVGLVCTNAEAFGRVVVEFWAAGLAVVGADTGAIPELLDNGERGCLYHKADGSEALYWTIRNLILDEDRFEALKEHGVEFAIMYDVKRTISSIWGGVYDSLLDHRRWGTPC